MMRTQEQVQDTFMKFNSYQLQSTPQQMTLIQIFSITKDTLVLTGMLEL